MKNLAEFIVFLGSGKKCSLAIAEIFRLADCRTEFAKIGEKNFCQNGKLKESMESSYE